MQGILWGIFKEKEIINEYKLGIFCARGKYNSFRADGKYSQYSIIFADYEAVVSLVSECRKGEELMDAIYGEICPQL